MSQKQFQVKPVRGYDKPHYLATHAPKSVVAEEGDDDRVHPATLLLSFLLVALVMIGLVGCYMNSEYGTEDPPDDDPDGDPPDPPDCEEGAIQCLDDWAVE